MRWSGERRERRAARAEGKARTQMPQSRALGRIDALGTARRALGSKPQSRSRNRRPHLLLAVGSNPQSRSRKPLTIGSNRGPAGLLAVAIRGRSSGDDLPNDAPQSRQTMLRSRGLGVTARVAIVILVHFSAASLRD